MYLPVQFQELSNGSWYGAGNLPVDSRDSSSVREAPSSNQPFADGDDDGVYEYENDDDTATTRVKDGPQRIPNTAAPERNAEEHERVNRPEECENGDSQRVSSTEDQ
jgi:hypothetical protein